MASNKQLIGDAIKNTLIRDLEDWKICKVKNDAGKLNTNDCIDCPLWFGMMLGGCCKSLRRAAAFALLRTEGGTAMADRAFKKRQATLVDFLERQLEDG